MDKEENLTELELTALDEFKFYMLDAAEKAIELLKTAMPRFDNIINAEDFKEEIDVAVDNYTYEAICEDDEEVEEPDELEDNRECRLD